MSQNKERFLYYLAEYEGLVFANAANYVDDHLVEDVAQDTFIKMYQHLDYLEDSRVKNWLIVVSGNIAKNYLKKGGKHNVESMEMTDLELCMEERYDSAEDCVINEEKQKAAEELLRTACNLLYEKNPKWYYIMIDSYYLGMNSKTIGKALGLTTYNVDVCKNRARVYLKKHLGKEYKEFFLDGKLF